MEKEQIFTENDEKLYLIRLPQQVAQILDSTHKKAYNPNNYLGDLTFGEIRVDEEAQQATLIVSREHDLLKRRWILKMDVLSEDPARNIGIVTESL